jgi:hypothetical protein
MTDKKILINSLIILTLNNKFGKILIFYVFLYVKMYE